MTAKGGRVITLASTSPRDWVTTIFYLRAAVEDICQIANKAIRRKILGSAGEHPNAVKPMPYGGCNGPQTGKTHIGQLQKTPGRSSEAGSVEGRGGCTHAPHLPCMRSVCLVSSSSLPPFSRPFICPLHGLFKAFFWLFKSFNLLFISFAFFCCLLFFSSLLLL